MANVYFTLDSNYGYVLLSCIIMALQCWIQGFVAGSYRRKYFTKEFMLSNFGDAHKSAFGTEPAVGGYPDVGNGRYSEKLTYEQWVNFNNAQRAHYNYLEAILPIVLFSLVAGLSFPVPTIALIWVCIVGRVAYGIGYTSRGPQGRAVGAIIFDLGLLALLILGIYSSLVLAGAASK
eukprot:GILI01004524.1.p2 GENE.GILI01004524.1~~GILI01004524.1.p2  ORF type:complete len:177 (-),score=58.13 GILI01004524.1:44-574(-)